MPSRHPRVRKTLFALTGCLLSLSAHAATITVNSLGDTGSDAANCELRSAIVAANTDAVVDSCDSGSGSDTIRFSVNGVITLTDALPVISSSLEILGPGQALLTVSGEGLYRPFVFAVGSGDHALKSFTLNKGAATFGGCILHQASSLSLEDMVIQQCDAEGTGGAMAASADTRINRSLFKENTSGASGGAVYFSTGGSRQIIDSSFVQNTAISDGNTNGGAIYITAGDLTITRSTFNQNSAATNGGAIYSTVAMSISHSTLVGNTANVNETGNGYGGGIYQAGNTLTIGNSIVSDNENLDPLSRPDIAVGPGYSLVTAGFNLIGANANTAPEFPAGSPNGSNDYVGTTISPLSAGLNALGDFGGPTPTMPPSADSLPVDHGNCPGQTVDQRGFSNGDTGFRVIDNPPDNDADGCDIGAVELELYLPEGVFDDGFEDPL